MALFIVAVGTGAYQVLPGVFAPVDLGDDMVDGHTAFFSAAILAATAVAFEDVFPGKHNPFAGHFDIIVEPDDGRDRYLLAFGAQDIAIDGFDNLRFPQIHQYDGAFYATYGKRLEILIQDQNRPVNHKSSTYEFTIDSGNVKWKLEDRANCVIDLTVKVK